MTQLMTFIFLRALYPLLHISNFRPVIILFQLRSYKGKEMSLQKRKGEKGGERKTMRGRDTVKKEYKSTTSPQVAPYLRVKSETEDYYLMSAV